ncbi:unnamed protein product [Cuscuta campestris]|uniref:Uncharacterized protein n=1 Tax=Cuscuta campestris TaxID=132261 RepID=A0A484NFG7_9ASTE|nr:unnamed protein product [Cuscuta campestris]
MPGHFDKDTDDWEEWVERIEDMGFFPIKFRLVRLIPSKVPKKTMSEIRLNLLNGYLLHYNPNWRRSGEDPVKVVSFSPFVLSLLIFVLAFLFCPFIVLDSESISNDEDLLNELNVGASLPPCHRNLRGQFRMKLSIGRVPDALRFLTIFAPRAGHLIRRWGRKRRSVLESKDEQISCLQAHVVSLKQEVKDREEIEKRLSARNLSLSNEATRPG